MRISDWISDVCSSDLAGNALRRHRNIRQTHARMDGEIIDALFGLLDQRIAEDVPGQILGNAADLLQRLIDGHRSEEHTSELQSLMRISYAVFCLTKKTHTQKI